MLSLEGFVAFSRDFARLNGLSEDEADRITAAIGDTPEIDEQGRLVLEGNAYLMPVSNDDD